MSSINDQYDELLKSHQSEVGDAIFSLQNELIKRNCKFGDEPLHTFLKPVFISIDEVETIADVIHHVIKILEKVTHLYFSHPDLRENFYVDAQAEKIINIEHRYPKNVIISRPDSFLIDGIMKFVEFNCDSPAGCGLSDVVQELFLQQLPFQKMSSEYDFPFKRRTDCLLEALLDAYKEFNGKNEHPNIAIVDWNEVRTQNEFQIIQARFKELGYETTIADPRELKFTNGRLEHNGFPIDLVYRRVIFKELMERIDQVREFIEADHEAKVCVVNPLRSRLASTKGILSIITNLKDYKQFFTEEEIHIINRHIPWTRRVIDMQTHYEDNPVFLYRHIIAHKDGLVLKPADSYGGRDVMIGCESDQDTWNNLVHRIIRNHEDWVVQKYVPITEMTVPIQRNNIVSLVSKKFNVNPFVLNHQYAGSMARLSDESVINVSAGGGLVPVMTYQRKERNNNDH